MVSSGNNTFLLVTGVTSLALGVCYQCIAIAPRRAESLSPSAVSSLQTAEGPCSAVWVGSLTAGRTAPGPWDKCRHTLPYCTSLYSASHMLHYFANCRQDLPLAKRLRLTLMQCNTRFTVVVWNRTHNVSEVCLYPNPTHGPKLLKLQAHWLLEVPLGHHW